MEKWQMNGHCFGFYNNCLGGSVLGLVVFEVCMVWVGYE